MEFQFSDNCWIGATTYTKERMDSAKEVFQLMWDMEAEVVNGYEHIQSLPPVRFVSCEPLQETVRLPLEHVDEDTILSPVSWVIIGAQSKTSGSPEKQPEWDWVYSLTRDAERAGVPCYWKPNLKTRPQEYPIKDQGEEQ